MFRHGHTTLIEIIRLAERLEIWLPPSTIRIVEANIRHVLFEEWKFRDEHTTLIEIIRLAESLENWCHHPRKQLNQTYVTFSLRNGSSARPCVAVRARTKAMAHKTIPNDTLTACDMVTIRIITR